MENLMGTHAVHRDGGNIGTLTITHSLNKVVFDFSGNCEAGGVLRLAGVSSNAYVNIGVVMPSPETEGLSLKKSFSKSELSRLRIEPERGFYLILSGENYAGGEPMPMPEPETLAAPEEAEPPEPSAEEEPEYEITPEAEEDVPEAIDEPIPESPEEATKEESPEQEAPEEESAEQEPSQPSSGWVPVEDPSVIFTDADIADACRNSKGALMMEVDGFTILAIPMTPGEPFPMMPVFCFGESDKIDGREYIIFKVKNGILMI